MSHPVAETFRKATQRVGQDPRRSGNVIFFEPGDHVIVAGDLHGHRLNLTKVLSHARLAGQPHRKLVLQEVIHGGPEDDQGGDRSFELLMRIARLMEQHPDQVYLLLGNHDTAQITGNEITKDGRGVCEAFRLGVWNAFGEGAEEVYGAISDFLWELPLAARCANGAFMSHSLPSPGREGMFDPAVLQRPVTAEDFHRGGAAYELLWGRRQDAELLHTLAERLEAVWFINGHQPQDDGYAICAERQLILASEHPRGCICEFDAGEPLDLTAPRRLVRSISSL